MRAERFKPFGVTRRCSLAVLVAGVAAGWARVARSAQGQCLPLSQSLPQELAAAARNRQPLVVMVSLERCPWCEVVREHYLAPMREREGLRVVQIDMLGKQNTHDIDGEPTTHGALVRRWEVKIAPTLVFLNGDGKEVAGRLEGGGSDFYSVYLDQRLEQARQAMLS